MSVGVRGGAGGSARGPGRVPEEIREVVQRGEENQGGELHSRGGGVEGERVLTYEGQQHLSMLTTSLLFFSLIVFPPCVIMWGKHFLSSCEIFVFGIVVTWI